MDIQYCYRCKMYYNNRPETDAMYNKLSSDFNILGLKLIIRTIDPVTNKGKIECYFK